MKYLLLEVFNSLHFSAGQTAEGKEHGCILFVNILTINPYLDATVTSLKKKKRNKISPKNT